MLLYSSYRFISVKQHEENEPKKYKFYYAVLTGGVIGFLAGLTGTGGGIFLSPLIIFCGMDYNKRGQWYGGIIHIS